MLDVLYPYDGTVSGRVELADWAEANRAVEAARKALAVDGRTLMAHLGCEPGREVGAALKHLAERVAASPELNRRDRLLAEIDLWRAKRDPA